MPHRVRQRSDKNELCKTLYSNVVLCKQAYDRKLTEVESQRAELEAQRLDLQRKLRDLQSANAEERARLKAQYQVTMPRTSAAVSACLRYAPNLQQTNIELPTFPSIAHAQASQLPDQCAHPALQDGTCDRTACAEAQSCIRGRQG